MREEKGAAAALVICMLPILIITMAMVTDLGLILWYRFSLMDVADLSALAGVQELDLAALARGEPKLEEAAAQAAAVHYARSNVQARLGNTAVRSLDITVDIYNGSEDDPLTHPYCRRELIYPTVCLRLALPVRLVLVGRLIGQEEFLITAHADAAAVWRSD